MGEIKIRFVAQKGLVGATIRFFEAWDFSHCEAVFKDGYLGAHYDSGVQLRPFDYDAKKWIKQRFVTFTCDDTVAQHFEVLLRNHINEPYDYGAIFGILLHDTQLHQFDHCICSGLLAVNLRRSNYFDHTLVVSPYEWSPRDLALVLSTRAAFSPIEENNGL